MKCKVSLWRKINATIWLFPAWFAPHFKLRAMFHRWRGVKMHGRVFIGYYCTLDNVHPEMITLEDGVFVGANSVILTHDNYGPRALGTSVSEPKPVHLKKGAGIGIGTLVQPGVTIGENSTVGAHSVVSKDIPDNVMCVLPRKEMFVSRAMDSAASTEQIVSIEDFIQAFIEQFEEPVDVSASTKFHELDAWDSLTAYSVISMIATKYGKKISGEDLRLAEKVSDVYNLVFKNSQ